MKYLLLILAFAMTGCVIDGWEIKRCAILCDGVGNIHEIEEESELSYCTCTNGRLFKIERPN